MYIGRVGDGTHPSDGIYILMKEIIDNAVDEFIMGQGKKIVVERKENTDLAGTNLPDAGQPVYQNSPPGRCRP